MAVDGSIVISMDIDSKKAMRELKKTEDQINKLNESLNEKRERRSALDDQAQEVGAVVDDARRKVDDLRVELEKVNETLNPSDMHNFTATVDQYIEAKDRQAEITKELEEQEKELAKQETAADRAYAAFEKADQAVKAEEEALAAAVERAGELSAALVGAKAAAEQMPESTTEVVATTEEAAESVSNLNAEYEGAEEAAEEAGSEGEEAAHRISDAMAKASGKVNKIGKRLIGMVRRIFFFSLITQALRGVRSWFSDILTSSDEAKEALGRLKGALLTLAQPLIEVIIPAFVDFVNILTRVVNAISSIVSKLFGTTIEQSAEAAENLYDEQQALKGVGSAAKKAGKQLAAFDQLNVLSDNASGGGSNSEIQPIFGQNGEDKLGEGYLNKILGLVKAIGAAFLAWKIGTGLGMNLKQMLGLALLLYSTFEFIGDFLRTWDEGITWDNLKQLLLDILGMAAGAYLAFGKIGAGIALVLGGLALLAVAFHDMNENGMTLENTLAAIAGLFAAGLGLSILTGSFVPLALAALGSLLLALVYLFGEGEEFTAGMQKIFGGLGQFFKSIFAGDVEGAIAGLKLAFEGLKQVSAAVARAVQKAWQALCDWIGQKLGPEWKAFFERIGLYFGNWLSTLKKGFNGIITFLKGVFKGDLELAMEGLKEVAVAIGNSLMNFIGMLINGIIDGLNIAINGINNIIGEVPDWLEYASLVIPGLPTLVTSLSKLSPISHWAVPALAQGAVIPPNREFLAVLGDQKSGTNIEAPLDTIVAAFKQAMGEYGGGSFNFYLDGDPIYANVERRRNQAMRATGR